MPLTREDPQPLRPQVRSAALRTAFLMALSAAVFWAVTSYADVVVQFLRGLGLRSRQIEPWRLPVMAVLIGLPAWRTLSAAYELIRLSHRLRVARTWERQLDDPLRAAEVPPLGTHLIRTTRTTLRTAVGILAGSVLVALGSVGFAVGAAFGVLPFRPSEDAVGYSWLVAVASGWAIVRASKLLGEARGAAMVERLSSSGPLEVEQESAARTQQVPQLTVHYAAALRPVPNRNAGRILYLRLFDNRAGTDEFVNRWRRYGVVHYLRSANQVTADELKTWSGRVGDLSVFIDNDGELEDFLAATHPAPGPDGGYPAGELLCHGSYWKRAVLRLLQVVDFVVLDLTGFHTGHGGTAFEVRSAIDLVDVERLKLTAASGSDQRFLTAQLQHAWSEMAADSPNAGTGVRTLTVHLG